MSDNNEEEVVEVAPRSERVKLAQAIWLVLVYAVLLTIILIGR